jgi:hypothetical protein
MNETEKFISLLEDAEHTLVICGKCYCPCPDGGKCAKCSTLEEIDVALDGRRVRSPEYRRKPVEAKA